MVFRENHSWAEEINISHAEVHVLSIYINTAFMQNQFYGFLLTIRRIVDLSSLVVPLSWDYLTKILLTMSTWENFVPVSYLCMSKLRKDRIWAWALVYHNPYWQILSMHMPISTLPGTTD